MSEKTSMFELLDERMEKEDIVKLVCNYDNKFNELEKEIERLNNKINILITKILLIDKFINDDKNLIPLHIKEYINIINDKIIKIGEFTNESI